MPDQDDVVEIECRSNLDHVGGVTVQRRILGGVVCREIRVARADVIEEHDVVAIDESRHDVPPHVLVAAEAVGEHHRLTGWISEHVDVVAAPHIHGPEIYPWGPASDTVDA